MPKYQVDAEKILDTFFHLPTLMAVAMVAMVIVWQMYEFSLDLGDGFIRLESIQGNITLLWQTGCCQLEW